jgi:hypothetical protein
MGRIGNTITSVIFNLDMVVNTSGLKEIGNVRIIYGMYKLLTKGISSLFKSGLTRTGQ